MSSASSTSPGRSVNTSPSRVEKTSPESDASNHFRLPAARGLLVFWVMGTATVVVTILVAALFTFSASIKLLGVAKSLEIRDHLGVKPLQWRLIGVCELAGVAGVLVGLVWAPIGIAAAIGLALLTIGAIAYHVRKSDTIADLAPAVIGVALALTTAVLHTL